MFKEHMVILFSCYLISNLCLIPIFMLNFSPVLGFSSNRYQLRVHKITVVLAGLCPFLIYIYSVSFPAWHCSDELTGLIGYFDTASVGDMAETYPAGNRQAAPNGMSEQLPLENTDANGGQVQQFIGSADKGRLHPGPNSIQLFPASTQTIVLDAIYFLIEYLLLITMCGLLYFLYRLLCQIFCLNRLEKHCDRRRIFKKLEIIFSSRITLPFSVRLLKRKVYLSENFTPDEKQIVLHHEFNHFRKNHHIWSIWERMLTYLFWFNPVSFYLASKGNLLREIECDEVTLKRTDKYVYSQLLLKLAESHLLGRSGFRMTQNLLSRHTLKKRIEYMLTQKISKNHIAVALILALVLSITAGSIYLYGNINDTQQQQAILKRINIRYAETLAHRDGVDITKVPQHFIDALLVSEDRDFFKHKGIQLYNIVKAAVFNLFHDRQCWLGASTITQQLAKQFQNEPKEKTFGRKFRELKIAKVLEKNFPKLKILEMYLNSIYFGNNAWGLKQASHAYFDHGYEKLSLKESALLVQSLVAPSNYNAIENPELAQQRKTRLIQSMVELGIVSHAAK